jgi:hypothetical protein
VLELPGFETIGFNDVANTNSSVSVYPNPSSGDVTIRSTDASVINAVRLFDISGRLILNQPISPSNVANISRNGLNKGVYLLETVTSKGKSVTKLILD